MFQFESDGANARFVMILSGDYSHDGEAAHRGLHKAAAEAMTDTDWFDMIVDMTDIWTAPTDRVNSGASMIQWCVANGLRRGAFVTKSAILRLQLKRISRNSERLAYFETRDEAERWLDKHAAMKSETDSSAAS